MGLEKTDELTQQLSPLSSNQNFLMVATVFGAVFFVKFAFYLIASLGSYTTVKSSNMNFISVVNFFVDFMHRYCRC